MPTITYTETPGSSLVYTGQTRTTNTTATDVVGLPTFTVADLSVDQFWVEAVAVRENTTNPLVYAVAKMFTWGQAGGVPAQTTSSPTQLYEHGDGSMDITMVLTAGANPVKVQVVGVNATTHNWVVNVRRRTLVSGP